LELLYVTKRLVLLVTPNAGLSAFFGLRCTSEPAAVFSTALPESSLKIVFAAFVIPRDERAMPAKF
jgi:hypothetical protein